MFSFHLFPRKIFNLSDIQYCSTAIILLISKDFNSSYKNSLDIKVNDQSVNDRVSNIRNALRY